MLLWFVPRRDSNLRHLPPEGCTGTRSWKPLTSGFARGLRAAIRPCSRIVHGAPSRRPRILTRTDAHGEVAVDGFRRFDESPGANIPERELLVWNDESLRASLDRGLADAAEGNVRRLDHLTEDVTDD